MCYRKAATGPCLSSYTPATCTHTHTHTHTHTPTHTTPTPHTPTLHNNNTILSTLPHTLHSSHHSYTLPPLHALPNFFPQTQTYTKHTQTHTYTHTKHTHTHTNTQTH